MKLSRVLAMALILSLTLSSPAFAASPKRGASCAKEGISKIYQGKKFTCIKKGKKFLWNKGVVSAKKPSSATKTTAPKSPSATTPASTSYTMEQVKANNTATSCWSVVNGSVYNLTNWIPLHPGGPSLIRALCGIDATSAFNSRHGNSPQPASQLANYLLGPLK